MQQTSDISTAKLVIVLTRADRSLTDFLEGGLALQGILTTDFAILEVFLHKGPLAMSAIGSKIPFATAMIKRAINRLKRRGLVRGQDHRNTPHGEVYELTEEGHKTITRVYARHKEDIEAVMGVLSPKERRQLWQARK